MRKPRFPYALLALLLCGLFCATGTQQIPADVKAFENQTALTIKMVRQDSTLTPAQKETIITNLESGVHMTRESRAQAQTHENREKALEELIQEKDDRLAKVSGRAGILDGLIAAAYILAGLLVVGLGFLAWRWFKSRAVAAVIP